MYMSCICVLLFLHPPRSSITPTVAFFVRVAVCFSVVGKLGHTGLVPFVDELGTVCWEVPLEYGFEVLI